MQAFSMIISFLNVLSPRTRMDRSAMTSSRQWSTHQRCKNSSNRSEFPSSAAWAPKTYLGRPGLCQPSHSTAATDIIGIDCDNFSLTMYTWDTCIHLCSVYTQCCDLEGKYVEFQLWMASAFRVYLKPSKASCNCNQEKKTTDWSFLISTQLSGSLSQQSL